MAGGTPNKELDAQLASVIEQDGVILNTPQGVRRRKKSATEKKFTPTPIAASPVTGSDAIEVLDKEVVSVHIGKGGGIPRDVQIHFRAHERSPYVVSLQHLTLSTEPEEQEDRIDIAQAHSVKAPGITARPLGAYASMGADLTVDADPWLFSTQFTADTFDEAYRAVYGRFDRVRQFFHATAGFAASMFQRAEHVEAVAMEDVKETFGVVEVARFSFARALAVFVGLAFIVTLPANAVSLYRSVSAQRNAATQAGVDAVASLHAATSAGTLAQSADDLRRASAQFRAVDTMLGNANALAVGVASLLPKEYRSARALTEVGDKASEAGRLLALGFDKVFSDPGRRVDERLDVLSAYAQSALSLLSDASKAAATVDPASVPASHRAEVTSLLSTLDGSTQALREFAGVAQMLSTMAGKDGLRKYLVIFQNPTELRPTGGFMGSFAEVTIDHGAVTDIRVPSGGTYDLQGQLLARVTPPKPLQLVASDWQFQDANWSPDFPTAAQKIRWFWSKSGQSTVDGVIAINATFVQNILKITGPIDMPEYGKTIDASNFLDETQKAVELEYNKEQNTPKKFIGDFSTQLVARMKAFTKNDWLRVGALVSDALETKDIQVALSHADEETMAEQYGWNGRLKVGSGDALALVEANIAGQKTDGVITEQASHQVHIAEDGSITETVSLTRTHNGKKGDLFNGVRNVAYLRVFVPKGSVLQSASGFQKPADSFFHTVDDASMPDPDIAASESTALESNGVVTAVENGETSFGGWMQLDPGQSQTITLTYRVPFTTSDILSQLDASPEKTTGAASGHGAYLLLQTSQSGKADRTLETTITFPSEWHVTWKRPDDLVIDDGTIHDTGTWDRDQTVALYFTPPNEQGQESTR